MGGYQTVGCSPQFLCDVLKLVEWRLNRLVSIRAALCLNDDGRPRGTTFHQRISLSLFGSTNDTLNVMSKLALLLNMLKYGTFTKAIPI